MQNKICVSKKLFKNLFLIIIFFSTAFLLTRYINTYLQKTNASIKKIKLMGNSSITVGGSSSCSSYDFINHCIAKCKNQKNPTGCVNVCKKNEGNYFSNLSSCNSSCRNVGQFNNLPKKCININDKRSNSASLYCCDSEVADFMDFFNNFQNSTPLKNDIKSLVKEQLGEEDQNNYNIVVLDSALPVGSVTAEAGTIPITWRGQGVEEVVAFAVPKISVVTVASASVIFSLVLNPGIVQDVIEGPPRMIRDGQVYQLNYQEAAYIRVHGNLSKILDANGNVIAKITTDTSGQANTNLNCNIETNCPTTSVPSITPPNIQKTLPRNAKNQQTFSIEGSELAKTLESILKDKGLGEKEIEQIRVTFNDGKTEIPINYFNMTKITFNNSDLAKIINAARVDGVRVQLHIGPGKTIDPIFDINPNLKNQARDGKTLVIAIDSQAQNAENLPDSNLINLSRMNTTDKYSDSMSNLFRQTTANSNTAWYIKMNIQELKLPDGYRFDYIKIVAPCLDCTSFSNNQEYFKFVAENLLNSGGRFDIVLHQRVPMNFTADQIINAYRPNIKVIAGFGEMNSGESYLFGFWKYNMHNGQFQSTFGPSTSEYIERINEPVVVLTIIKSMLP